MATEVEQLYLQLELINIEEQMLKLQMLKHSRQRRRLRRWSVGPLNRLRLGTGEFTTLVHPLNRRSYTVEMPEKHKLHFTPLAHEGFTACTGALIESINSSFARMSCCVSILFSSCVILTESRSHSQLTDIAGFGDIVLSDSLCKQED